MEHAPFVIALIIGAGFLANWLAWRIRVPAILFLLLIGIVAGPVMQWFDPDVLLGDLLFPIVSLAVAIILFEGSLTLRIEETRGIERIIRNLVTVGFLATWAVMALAGHYLAGLAWPLAILFGALVSVTGPTVIAPLVRSVRPTRRIANMLRWEGILVDPIGAICAVLAFNALLSGQEANPLVSFGLLLVVAIVFGLAGGLFLAATLRRHWIPEYLHNFATLATVVVVFTASNLFVHESGLLAVTVMGIRLANYPELHVEDILDFKEALTLVLLSFLFIILGARLDLALLLSIAGTALLILAAAKLVARPAAIALSSIGTSVNLREGLFLSWIAPRGIVAAAVAALFALKLEGSGYPGADLLVPLTFAVIIGTVVIESLTAGLVARMLGVSAADEQGVLIVGANKVANTLATSLRSLDIPVLMADVNFEDLRTARMAGIATYYGNVLSEHADNHLDLTGIERVFAITRNPEFDTLVCTRYRPEVEAGRVYSLAPNRESDAQARKSLAVALKSPKLFGPAVSWAKLASLVAQGWTSKATPLSEDYGFDEYRRDNPQAMLLYARDASGNLKVWSTSEAFEPESGWRVCALTPPEEAASAST